MKILFLSEDFLPNIGGIASHITNLAAALVRRGHEVTVLKPMEEQSKEWVHDDGFTIIHRKKDPWPLHTFFIRRALKNLIESRGFDLLHWHQLVGYETKGLARVPKVFTNHTSMYLQQYKSTLGRLKLKCMLHHVDAIISPSVELQNKSIFIRSRAGNFYVPNGVDEQKFKPGEGPRFSSSSFCEELQEKKKHGYAIILCPRRLAPKCGVRYFIESIPGIITRHPKSVFVVAGRGGFFEEEKKLKSWLADRNLEQYVYFLGDVENAVMPLVYQCADVVVFPSLLEATSISCLEAMASEKAIIATNVGGLPELIDDGVHGMVIESRNAALMAEKVCWLLDNPAVGAACGRAARKRVLREFTWDVIAEKTEKIYKGVLKVYERFSS